MYVFYLSVMDHELFKLFIMLSIYRHLFPKLQVNDWCGLLPQNPRLGLSHKNQPTAVVCCDHRVGVCAACGAHFLINHV